MKKLMDKFSLAQMTSNDNGKTSASGTIGCLICTAGAICFLWGSFTKQPELINQCIAYTAIGAGLLGYRKGKESIIPLKNLDTINSISVPVNDDDDTKQELPPVAPPPADEPVIDQPLNS